MKEMKAIRNARVWQQEEVTEFVPDLLPVYKVEHGAILSVRGDITVGFRLELPEIFTLSAQEYETLHQARVKGLRLLPAWSVYHQQDWFLKAHHHRKSERSGSFLAAAGERFFEGREYQAHTSYVFLTKLAEGKRPVTSALSGLLRRRISPPQTVERRYFELFLEKAEQLARVLSDTGLVQLKRLTDEDLAGTDAVPGVIERYCFLLGEKDRPLLKDVRIREGLQIGKDKLQLFTLADAQDLPGYCGSRVNYDAYSTDQTRFSVGLAAPLGLLLPGNHICNQFILTGDNAATIKRLEQKRRRLQSLSAYSRENAAARDATAEFLQEAVTQQRLPVKAHFNVLAWGDDAQNIRNEVSAAMAVMDAVPREESDGAAQLWWAALPGNAAELPVNEAFDTFLEQACCFLNAESNYRCASSGFGLRLGDRLSGRPLLVDISDEPMRRGLITNRNKIILGPSGSGKSFFTNHLVRCYLEQAAHVVLIDVGHSYQGICALLGGYYFTYSAEKPICFNPFFIAPGDSLDIEKRESLKTLLLTLWKKEDESFRRSEYVAVSQALALYYERLGQDSHLFPCFNTFYEFLEEGYTQVLEESKVMQKEFDLVNFLYVLKPFYRGGEFDYLLNAKDNLDLLGEKLIVFELDNVKDHPILFPVVTIIIMEVFISKMRKLPKDVRKVILVEEAWKAIARNGMAEYLKYLFKTVRKYFGEAIVVTQEVEDILASPIIKQAIVNNSDCKILLDQSKYQNKFADIQALLALTEKEKALVLSLNKANDHTRRYKEVFISLGGQSSKVYRTEVSPEEYLTYTTESSEKARVERYAKRHGSLEAGIRVLAAEMNRGAEDFNEGI